MLDVITLGSAVYDIFVYTEPSDTEIIRLKHPKEKREHIAYPTGAKILIDAACFDIGGGATNTATTFSRLGFKTGTLCKIGNDFYGEQILNCLKKEKVSFLGTRGTEHTDFSIILDSKGHDRTILAYKGCSNMLRYAELKSGKIKSKWLYISSLVGESFKAAEKLAARAKSSGTKIAFNPSTYLASHGYNYLKKMLKNTDALILNREEAAMIAGNPITSQKGWSNEERLLRALFHMGPEYTVITDGAKGAYALREGAFYKAKAHKNTKIVETTGAGDAFASSFIAGLMKNKGIEYSLQMGIANAESVISHFGAHNKLLNWKEMQTAISKKPANITSA